MVRDLVIVPKGQPLSSWNIDGVEDVWELFSSVIKTIGMASTTQYVQAKRQTKMFRFAAQTFRILLELVISETRSKIKPNKHIMQRVVC